MRRKLWLPVLLVLCLALTVGMLVACDPGSSQDGTQTPGDTTTPGGNEPGDENAYTEGLVFEDIGGSYSVTGYEGTDTEVVIPETYEDLPVTVIAESAFADQSTVTSVTIPDSVTSIGSSAFSGCSSLEIMTIPFVGATKEGASDTHFGYIFGAQRGDDNKDYVPASLKEVIIIGGTSIGDSAFRNCDSLTSVTIPDGVMSIGDHAFYSCNSLTSITIPDSVTSIGDQAFQYCDSLTSIAIPDSVTSIGGSAFSDCSSLTSVTIGDGVTSIGVGAFWGCTSLTSITIPNSVMSIGGSAFRNCVKLIEVYDKSSLGITAGSTANGYVGYYAKHVYTEEGGSWLTDTEDGFRFFWDGETGYLVAYLGDETRLTLPESFIAHDGTGVTSYQIYERAFYGRNDLTSVTIPDSVTSIGVGAFYNCASLTSITIGDSVKSIGQLAFWGCTSLTSVTIPDSVKSIGSYAFNDCYKLVEVYNKSSLGITAGSIVGHGSVGEHAKHVYTDEGGSWLTDTEDGYRFIYDGETGYLVAYLGSETELTLPDSFTAYDGTEVTSYQIYDYAFYGRNDLTSVTIPDSVTSIGDNAFSDCTSLTSITIPNSVTRIEVGAFLGCTSLTSVTFEGTMAEWNAVEKANDWAQECPLLTEVKCSDGTATV